MGTRSIIAIPEGKTGFRGRYVHWDGYPEGVGESLRQIIKRDGAAKAIQTLILEHYGWSTINEVEVEGKLGMGMDDGRFVPVPGYGVAYTTEQNQSSPDDWHTRDNAENSWCEWAYVIHDDRVDVYANHGGKWNKCPKHTMHFDPSPIPALDTEDLVALT